MPKDYHKAPPGRPLSVPARSIPIAPANHGNVPDRFDGWAGCESWSPGIGWEPSTGDGRWRGFSSPREITMIDVPMFDRV